MIYIPLRIEQGVNALKQGKIIAYPTEAVFGLGCDPQNEQALMALLELKKRTSNKGMILIASALEQIIPYIDVSQVPKDKWEAIQHSWPGPFTFVFPATKVVHPSVKGQFTTVAVRVTAHPLAKQLCEAFGGAIISTSANVAACDPLKDAQAVYDLFGQSIAGVVEGKVGDALKPTQIQDAITGEIYR